MKSILIFSILAYATIFLSVTSCMKTEDTTDVQLFTEQPTQSVLNNQMAIIGSWQFTEKGVEIDVHNGQPCSFTGTKTPMVKWEAASINEQRDFLQKGDYNHFLEKKLSCQGSFKISNDANLAIIGNCEVHTETIVELTTTSLIIKTGNNYYKYLKVN